MYLIYLSEPVIILFLSVLLDQVFGEPENRHHPVAFIGAFIDRMDQYFRRLSTGRLGGTVFVIVVTFIVLSIILIVQYASSIFLALYIIVSAIILKFSFSLRSMKDHVLPVIESIERGDLVTAR
ncbi:MAG: cobalamin biosynthesis protein, partial [Thermoplasmataceae archaeon]